MSKTTSTIMVVEDEAMLLEAITKKLKISKFEVIPFVSGQDAIAYVNNNEPPDAIWLDYYLKDTNGLAFMEQVKQHPKWNEVPVIVVSNSAKPEKVHNMLSLGAKKYILKAEYRLEEIIDIIQEFIKDKSDKPVGDKADNS